MWNYPQIDPVAISLGPIQIHWYALSYLIGISIVWWHLGYRNRQMVAANASVKSSGPKKNPKAKAAAHTEASPQQLQWTKDQLSDLVFFAVLGVILGGRFGYMLFYGMDQIIENPLSIIRLWEGGMSFHGGMLGVFLGMWWFGRKNGRTFFEVTDFIAPSIPIALGCGRLGNFINGELPGRVTDVPWAVIFPGDSVARHPSSLYQATLEGPVLFLVLWFYSRHSGVKLNANGSISKKPTMSISGMFLVGYGTLRFGSEFLRRPDQHMGDGGFIAFDWLTTGQLLSIPMVVCGIVLIILSHQSTSATENS